MDHGQDKSQYLCPVSIPHNGLYASCFKSLPSLAAEPPIRTTVKLTGMEFNLIVLGLIVFSIGSCVGALIGMVLLLKAYNVLGGNHVQYLYD